MESDFEKTQLLKMIINDINDLGRTVKVSFKGNSMIPLLRQSVDQVELGSFKGIFKKGDIVLVECANNEYVLHRVIMINNDNKQFFMVGDAQQNIEGPLDYGQIVAVTVAIFRRGRRIGVENPLYLVYVWVWYKLMRFRPRLLWGLRKLRIIP